MVRIHRPTPTVSSPATYLRWQAALGFFLGMILVTSAASAQDYAEGRLLVKMKGQTSFQAMNQLRHQKSGSALHLNRSWQGLNMHEVSVPAGQDVNAMVQSLEQNPDIEFVEPDYYLYQQSMGVEPGTELEYNAFSVNALLAGPQYLQSNAPVGMEEAWSALSNYPDHVVVAVIDSGVDYEHEIFEEAQAIWINPREVQGSSYDHDGNGYPGDVHGWNFVSGSAHPMDDSDHGTHVAGIILGVEQNIFSAPQASRIKIMALKFLDASGRGATSDAIQAIFYAVNNGAKVINASWGGGGYSQSLRDAIQYAYANDVFFVAAAGNQATNNDQSAIYPASYDMPNLLSVAATNDYDYLTTFSNYGKHSVALASPGQSILSTLPNNSLGRMSGTSMAAPLAAGLAALMYYENPNLTPHQIKRILADVSDSFHHLDPYVSSGRVNALDSVIYSQSGDLSAYPARPAAAAREVASDMGGGCAAAPFLGKLAADIVGRGPGGPSWPAQIGVLFALLSPLLVLLALRALMKTTQKSRRRYDRYQIQTDVRIEVGGREFMGSVSSLSLGGVKVDTSALLEDGGLVQMKIMSPDGTHEIEVQGEIVWSEKEKSYGVAFSELGKTLRKEIGSWQKSLVKAAS